MITIRKRNNLYEYRFEGCEIKDISKVLGHSRIETIENYYINCTKDNLEEVSKSFEKELGLNFGD